MLGGPINTVPKIHAPQATDVTSRFTPQPKSASLLQPGMSPGQYLGALEQNKLTEDAIKTLAYGMPERESVWYACQSSHRVADKMTSADLNALNAAEAWVKDPTPETKAQAAAAAKQTDYQGPGAWAAQSAAWSQTTPGVPAQDGIPGVEPSSLTPHAASGSVMLAVAMEADAPVADIARPSLDMPEAPEMPVLPDTPALPGAAPPSRPEPSQAELTKTAEYQQPHVDLGKDIACGKNTWA
jgi:hypothetical protein